MTKSYHTPLVLKFDDWPATDQSAWNTLFAKGVIFEDEGPCIEWSEGSRSKRRQGYGQWLSFLKRTRPDMLALSPIDRIVIIHVRDFITETQARVASRSVSNLVSDLYVIARSFAPDINLDWLKNVSKRLLQRSNRHALAPRKQITAEAIFSWSITQMHDVDGLSDVTSKQRAIWFRQALMIGLLISRPVRRRTFIGIRLGTHLSEVSDGFIMHFRPEDMKDKRHHSYPIPETLVEPTRRYLDIHRPVLLQGKSSDGLWVNQYGNVITADGYARELPKITQKHLGIELRPHAFRHIAATSIAEVDPEHVGIIRDILGHATLDMAYKHYNRASQISSCKGLQSIVEDICKNVPKIGRAKQRLLPPDNRFKS